MRYILLYNIRKNIKNTKKLISRRLYCQKCGLKNGCIINLNKLYGQNTILLLWSGRNHILPNDGEYSIYKEYNIKINIYCKYII